MWQKFYEEHRSDTFEILSIAVDVQGSEVARPYVQQHGVTFPVVVDMADVFGSAFGLKAIPVSFLVDEVGIVRMRGGGPSDEFLKQVEEVLKEPLTAVRGEPPRLPEARSVEELSAAVEANSEDLKSRLGLARLLHEAGELEAALEHIRPVAGARPRDPQPLFTWGMILLAQGHKEAALEKLKASRDLDPKNWRIRKQIWAIEHPDKFYTGRSPDFDWQKEELKREEER